MKLKYDILIVGTGVAGMFAALNLRTDLNILMITKSKPYECNSYLAQGGITTTRDEEDKELLVQDTLKAGQFKNDLDVVRILADEAEKNISSLVEMGVKFDLDKNGFEYTREGAHSEKRIVHCDDETGKKVTEALYANIRLKKNITILEETCLVDILIKNNNCIGAVAVKEGKQIDISAKVTILACGGIGGVFKNSTNQRTLTGDGIAIALKHNITVKDLQFIQIHPTALYEAGCKSKKFLISESVRGEGAKLKNIYGEGFVDELLPRDVVTNAILEEQKKTKNPYVLLDISCFSKGFLINRFPGIYRECLIRGIDITKGFIPVTPVMHYLMGGIQVDSYSRTSMQNLYACGETSCTGVHGANRLASNSLLEALVFSRRAAEKINSEVDAISLKTLATIKIINESQEIINNLKRVVEEIKKVSGDDKYELVDY